MTKAVGLAVKSFRLPEVEIDFIGAQMGKAKASCPVCGNEGREISRYSWNEVEKVLYLCSNKACQHGTIELPFTVEEKSAVGNTESSTQPKNKVSDISFSSSDRSAVPHGYREAPNAPLQDKEPLLNGPSSQLKGSPSPVGKKICLFIDGESFYFGLKRNNFPTRVDYFELSKAIVGKDRNLVRTYYYNAAYDATLLPEQWKNQRSFIESLEKTPYLESHWGRILPGQGGGFRQKGMDVLLATDLVFHAAKGIFDTGVLITDDPDFSRAILQAKSLGVHVEIGLFRDHQPKELVRAGDNIVRLDEVLRSFEKDIFPQQVPLR